MNQSIKSIKYKKHTINIVEDADCSSPRENDNITKMVMFHNSYNLGDEQTNYNKSDYSSS